MDLREIIKWFIPCFHILLKFDPRMLLLCLLFCNLCPGSASSVSEVEKHNSLNNTKETVNYEFNYKYNQSEVLNESQMDESRTGVENSVGRTFGRPMKKLMQALIPLAVAIGSAGTWAVVAALIGAKTLIVALFILKLLLMGAAAKFGGLLASKTHAPLPPPGKEIHLHIHNGHHPHEEEVIPNLSPWSRDSPATAASMTAVQAVNPYQFLGPQTIRTPYGNYVRVDPGTVVSG